MPPRPPRQRHAPQRFGTFASAQQAEELEAPSEPSDEEQEAAPRRRGRAPAAKRRRAAPSSEEEEEPSEASEGSEDEPRPRKRGRKQAVVEEESESDGEGSDQDSSDEAEAAAAPSARPARRQARFVPQPPPEPRSGSDMLGLLFACPALIDALLEPDGLRPVTLVARDAAHLAAALGARAADMADLWCQLARRLDPRLAAAGVPLALPQALEVVQRAVRADPARHQRLRTTDAEKEYRVTRGELKDLPFTTEHSYSFWANTIKKFRKLDVLAIAHRKWGTMAVLEEERAAAAAKSSRAKQSREAQRDKRERELTKALQKAGLPGPKNRSHSRAARRRIKAFIKKGQGTVQGLLDAAKQESEAESGRQKRQLELIARLKEEGLDSERWGTTAQSYISGQTRQTLTQAVAAIKAAKQEVTDRDTRRTRITELFTQQGLAEFLPQQNAWGWGGAWGGGYYGGHSQVAGLIDYVRSGTGSEAAVLAAAQALVAERQAREARQARITELLAAEGLQQHISACHSYIHLGTGSEEAAMAAARAAAERLAARQARRARIQELLAAEGMEQHIVHCEGYIEYAEGSEEAAVERARQAHQKQQERQARRAALTAALQAEGIQLNGHIEGVLYGFIHQGIGSQDAALEAARKTHQAAQEREQRREQLTTLMAAEGLSLVNWEWRLPGLHSYLHNGGGNRTAEEFVAQARAMSGQGAANAVANAYAV